MSQSKAVGWMSLVLIGWMFAPAVAADKSAVQLYGIGVHDYFSANYQRAVDSLSAAIKAKETDPRPFYFRGLALAQMKGLDAAIADFRLGADTEVNRADRPYDINVCLQRVQGPLRLAIEKERATARKAAANRKKKRDQVRYEQLKRREKEVLFDPDRPAPKVSVPLPEIKIDQNNDPFASDRVLSGGKLVNYTPPVDMLEEPETAPTAPGDEAADPFAEIDAKKPKAAENPFGEMKAPAKGGNPFGEETPKAEENPFGDMPGDNPFGGVEGPGPPQPGVGTGGGKPSVGALFDLLGRTLSGNAGERDPFGDGPAEKRPSKEDPAKKAPAEKGAADNPFK